MSERELVTLTVPVAVWRQLTRAVREARWEMEQSFDSTAGAPLRSHAGSDAIDDAGNPIIVTDTWLREVIDEATVAHLDGNPPGVSAADVLALADSLVRERAAHRVTGLSLSRMLLREIEAHRDTLAERPDPS